MIQVEAHISEKTTKVNAFVESLFSQIHLPSGPAIARLAESMKYSATNGGKRFRPVLSLLVGEIFGCEEKRILPFAAAVEFIHTYSLIHDDLPCMDNDDFRRGKPTNHKVYGEALALLAGDALLTESFLLIARAYPDHGFLLGRLVDLLSTASGLRGMIGGQAIDMAAQKMDLQDLTQMHRLKTGCLIRLAVEGAALIAGAKTSDVENLTNFGEKLGLAFQVADDLLDHAEKGQEERSFVTVLNVQGTQDYLQKISAESLASLRQVTTSAPALEYLIHFNQSRKT